MRKIKRAVHFDFHTMPGVEDFGAKFSAEDFAKQLADAHVDYVNVFARCNVGFSYYPTKIGTPYPTLNSDLLGDTIEACHKHGIEVTAYLNGGLNHELLVKRPELLKINKDGSVYSGDPGRDHFFRNPCHNAGYKQYLLDEISEILEKNPDGIFVDCLIPSRCYCPSCIRMMREKGIDIDDDAAVYTFAVDTLKSMFAQIRALVPQDKRLYLNSFPYADIHAYQSHAELECLPTDPQWGYDFYTAQAAYFRKFTDELIYMTGRFVLSWGDLAGYKSRAALESDIYDALMYGFAPSVGDHMHPRDGIDRKLYQEVGEIYSYVQKLEPYTDGAKAITEAAILRNKVSFKEGKRHLTDSDKGAARMLSELKICFDVVDEDMELDSYKLLVLPDHIRITEKLAAKLDGFKGSILSTGESLDTEKSAVWDYITDYCPDTNTDGFYTINGGSRIYAQYDLGIKMHSDHSIAAYVEPYFQKGYDGIHGYSYIPPKSSEGYSAIALKGNKAHICFPVFESYLHHGAIFHKDLVTDLLDKLLPERLIVSSESDPAAGCSHGKHLPSSARITFMQGTKGDVLHVKTTFPVLHGQIGIVEEHIIQPAGVKLSIAGEYSNVYALPEMAEVKCTAQGGRTEITLPEICGYMPFLLTK